ncbi:MAG: class I SAM-dependent methyltransferase [Firmicutes bacterium]|nr:class I SAM-dependent methyltransferase [Bacillota bacterium]
MLTPRLECIVKQIRCKTVGDIGTDHAYVPIRLIQSGRAETAIACDVIEGPLKNARKNIAEYSLSDKIETRLSYGLDALAPNEADTIVIAGMGGDIIMKILERGEQTARGARLVLQPMKAQYELRKFLTAK